MQEKAERDAAAQACALAFETWLTALFREYEERGFNPDELRPRFEGCIEAVEQFLSDDQASAELLRPLTTTEAMLKLDGSLLMGRWQAMGLPVFPEGFDVDRACRWYVEELNRHRVFLKILRSHLETQMAMVQAERLSAIRGLWAAFNLDRYADAMRERYQAVDVTTLERPGRQGADDETIRLKGVFIPQDVRRSRPRRILSCDYLKKHRKEPLLPSEVILISAR